MYNSGMKIKDKERVIMTRVEELKIAIFDVENEQRAYQYAIAELDKKKNALYGELQTLAQAEKQKTEEA